MAPRTVHTMYASAGPLGMHAPIHWATAPHIHALTRSTTFKAYWKASSDAADVLSIPFTAPPPVVCSDALGEEAYVCGLRGNLA